MCHQLLLWIVTCWENNLAFLGEPDCYDCLWKMCYFIWNDPATMQIYANNADIVQSKYRYSPSALSTFGTSHHAEATEAVGKVKRIAPRCLCDQSERFWNNANADSTVQIPIKIQSISISVVQLHGPASLTFGIVPPAYITHHAEAVSGGWGRI